MVFSRHSDTGRRYDAEMLSIAHQIMDAVITIVQRVY
jgi:hypothetical protein